MQSIVILKVSDAVSFLMSVIYRLFMLSVIKLNVIMLIVVAPIYYLEILAAKETNLLSLSHIFFPFITKYILSSSLPVKVKKIYNFCVKKTILGPERVK
jgi:hypothetical protein